jgi:hypothetical protein
MFKEFSGIKFHAKYFTITEILHHDQEALAKESADFVDWVEHRETQYA